MGNKTKQTIIKEKCVDMNISESHVPYRVKIMDTGC